MGRRSEIDVRPWQHYLAAFDLYLDAISNGDGASIAITRAIMRYELSRPKDAEDLGLASPAEWGNVGFTDHPPFAA